MVGKRQLFTSFEATLRALDARYPQRLIAVLAESAPGKLLVLRGELAPPTLVLSPLDTPQKAVKERFLSQFGVSLPTLSRVTKFQLVTNESGGSLGTILVMHALVEPLEGRSLLDLTEAPLESLRNSPFCDAFARVQQSGLLIPEQNMSVATLHRAREVA